MWWRGGVSGYLSVDLHIDFLRNGGSGGSKLLPTPATSGQPITAKQPDAGSDQRGDDQQKSPDRGKDKRRRRPGKGQGRSEPRSRQEAPDIQKLVEATAKLALHLADANQVILQDCGFTLFISREEGSILPVMFGVSTEWRCIKEATPEQVTRPLYSIMLECVLKELVARIQQADQSEHLQKAAKEAQWINAEKAWLYKRWEPQSKTLVAMDKPPLTTTLLQILAELMQDARVPEGLRRLTQEMASQVMDHEVCFSVQVALRGDVVNECIATSTCYATTWR